jgi:hypothetical protein
MSELAKTYIFIGVALICTAAAVGLGMYNTPRDAPVDLDDRGEKFFRDLKDPLSVTSMEIVKYDSATNQPVVFKVAQVSGIWCIPSHNNYPADAKDQLAEAATSVMDLAKIDIISDDKKDHKLFGVLDPDPKMVKAGDTGVGTRVVLFDKDNKPLAQLIIGDTVKDRPELRYVRVPNRDRVYVTKVNTAKLSTKFEDWIERDLLQYQTLDLKRVEIRDYSIDTVNERLIGGEILDISYDEAADFDKRWKLADLKPGEKVENQKLNDMNYAFDDLKIIDVRPKAEKIGRWLAGEGEASLNRAELQSAAASLGSHGFHLLPVQEGGLDLMSKEGDIRLFMKDGIEYILRFGNVAEDRNPRNPEEKGDQEASSPASSRYVLVAARFNPELISKPDLEPLPGAAPKPAGPAEEGQPPADNPAPAAPPAQPQTPRDSLTEFDTIKKEGLRSGAELEAETKRIEAANKRKLDDYNDKVKKGQDRAKALNKRFAPWYFVISEDVYKKIHLRRVDIVKTEATVPAADNTSTSGTTGSGVIVDDEGK